MQRWKKTRIVRELAAVDSSHSIDVLESGRMQKLIRCRCALYWPGSIRMAATYTSVVKHDGTLMPGKVVSTHKACYVARGDQERAEESYQVLIRNQHCEFAWVAVSDGQIPNGALQGGVAEDKEAVFIGRGMVEGATSVGPVYPSRGVCTLPYGGQMIETSEYEVLVVKSIPL